MNLGISLPMLALIATLSACAEAMDDGGDAGNSGDSGWGSGHTCELAGRSIPVGMGYAEPGGNECFCWDRSCDGSVCPAVCTPAVADAGQGQPSLVSRCSATEPCSARGTCYYDPGCASPQGYCAYVQTHCDPMNDPVAVSSGSAEATFCGCDGVTYGRESSTGLGCPLVPYAHTGPCP